MGKIHTVGQLQGKDMDEKTKSAISRWKTNQSSKRFQNYRSNGKINWVQKFDEDLKGKLFQLVHHDPLFKSLDYFTGFYFRKSENKLCNLLQKKIYFGENVMATGNAVFSTFGAELFEKRNPNKYEKKYDYFEAITSNGVLYIPFSHTILLEKNKY